jgi:hypothetical protein
MNILRVASGRYPAWVLVTVAVALLTSAFVSAGVLVGVHPAYAANNAQKFCTDNFPRDKQVCIDAYNAMYKTHSDNDFNNLCNRYATQPSQQAACLGGRGQGARDGETDRNKSGTGTSNTSTDTIVRLAQASDDCKAGSQQLKNSCIAGFIAGYRGTPSVGSACRSGATVSGYRVTDTSKCRAGYSAGNNAKSNGGTSPTNTVDVQPTAATSDNTDENDDCDAKFYNPLTWIICPIVDGTNKAIEALDNGINSMLTVGTTQIFDVDTNNDGQVDQDSSGYSYRQVWAAFRDIALGIVFISVMVVIISSALGLELLDAYTIRKTLPRVLIAILFIVLSWPILEFLITLTNDAGNGIRALIYAPFQQNMQDLELGFGGLFLSSLLLGVGLIALGPFGLLSFALTALVAVLIAFAVLIVRELIIIFLVLIAPIGIACMILPNTRKVWEFWQKTLVSMLVVFPIIAGMIAVGRVFAAVTYANGNASGLEEIIAFIAYILPYFLLLFAFRLAGGLMGTLAGIASNRSSGLMKGMQGYRGRTMQSRGHRMKEGNLYRSSNPLARGFNAASMNVAGIGHAGTVPWKMRSRFQSGMSRHKMDTMAKYMEESSSWKAIQGNDDYLQATMENMGGGKREADWRRYLMAQGYQGRSLEQAVANIRAAKRDTSDEVFDMAAVVANSSTGTGWKDTGVGGMMESINEVAGDDRDVAARMLAEMRGRAGQARRVDLAGSGFGKQIGVLNAMYDGHLDAKTGAEYLNENALDIKAPSEIVQSRGYAMMQMAPRIRQRIETAHARVGAASTPQQRVQAERQLKQEYASLANMYDDMSRTSPENAKILADNVMNAQIEYKDPAGGTLKTTVYDQMSNFRTSDSEFVQMRREYGYREAEQEERAKAAAEQAGEAGGGGDPQRR